MPLVSTLSISSGVGGRCDGCGGDPLTLLRTLITYLLVFSPNSLATSWYKYRCHPNSPKIKYLATLLYVVGNEAHFVLECLLYNYSVRERFPSLFKNAVLGSLKSFYELDILTLIVPFSVC
jgi:hypothetical protein